MELTVTQFHETQADQTEANQILSQIVSFNPEPADQALWSAIAQVLAQQPHNSFSHLCKQALQQYLMPEKPASVPPPSQRAIALFVHIERQIIELQLKVSEVEQRVALGQTHRIDQLERQLAEVNQRLGQLEKPMTLGIPEVKPTKPPREIDPLLMRLGSLLEEF